MNVPASRRTYLDVLRGVTVLIMIEAHVIDSWTHAADRRSRAFADSLVLGGFAAPLFLFLAGVAVSMSAGSKARRLGDSRAAAAAVRRRGLQIFLLAFLFRLQSFVLSHSPAWTLLRVDILNIMGPAMILAAALWGLCRTAGERVAVFATATIAVVLATPAVRALEGLSRLPDPIEAYIRPLGALSNFTFLPWMGFLLAGAAIGVILDAARDTEADRRVNLLLLIAGSAIALTAYKMSFLPPLHPRSSFWTTSVSFFFIRLGIMTAAIGMAWLWEQRPSSGQRWSPLQVLGASSLFVYWVHVELVYGAVSTPLHGAFSLPVAWAGFAGMCALMLWAAVQKDRMKRKYHENKGLRERLSRGVQPLMF